MKLTKKQRLYRGIIFILIGIFMLLYMVLFDHDIKEYSKGFFYMDTYINVKIYSSDIKKSKTAMIEIDKIYNTYHKLTNRYDYYSGVKNVYYINNEIGPNEKVEIEKELYEIIEYGIDAHVDSDGLFNIAIGNAVDVWKKYKDQGYGVPTYSELSNKGSLNIEDIVLHDNYIIEKQSGVKIDLGGISKGYATEVVGDYLESIGLKKYIINAGGNVKVGSHYNNGNYKIGVEEPNKDSKKIYKIIRGNNISVVTSGSYERFYEYNDEIYHHIINPKTLYPPKDFASVTIIAKDSKVADILSTVVFLMPLEDGMAYVDSLKDVEALWYDSDGKIHYSKGFSKYEQK